MESIIKAKRIIKMKRKKNGIIEGGQITCPLFDFLSQRGRSEYQ